MKVSAEKVRRLCRSRGLKIESLLDNATVSRNAYYTLCRKDSILPKSIERIARELDVPTSALLREAPTPSLAMRRLLGNVERIVADNPDADRDNVRHTLLLLGEPPAARLRRALLRGRTIDIRK